MNEKEIEILANKITSKVIEALLKIKTVEEWFEHNKYKPIAHMTSHNELEMTEEEEAIGDIAKLMTLKNLFEDKEQYEKCEIVKQKIEVVKDILKNYK